MSMLRSAITNLKIISILDLCSKRPTLLLCHTPYKRNKDKEDSMGPNDGMCMVVAAFVHSHEQPTWSGDE